MPEQISKYPDVTLDVLKGAGAVCGEGAKQEILTQCPEQQFCALESGEICVYGIENIPEMTQIEPRELAEVVCPGDATGPRQESALLMGDGVWMIAVFLAGFGAGAAWKRLKRGLRRRE